MSNQLTLVQRIRQAFKWCNEKAVPNKSKNDALQGFRSSCVKAVNFCLSRKGTRFLWLLLLIAASLDAVFIFIYFAPLNFLPLIPNEQQWLALIMLFFWIFVLLSGMIAIISLCAFFYRDAFVKNDAIGNELNKSFSKLKEYIMGSFTIIMSIEALTFMAYDYFSFERKFNFMWVLLGTPVIVFFLSLISGFITFEKFKNNNDLLPFSAWKIVRTLCFSWAGFFCYALFFYKISDQSFKSEVWFLPLIQWMLFMYHFMFISEKKELTIFSVVFSMFLIVLSPVAIFGVLRNVDKGIMTTIGVREKNMIVNFNESVCHRAATILQCDKSTLKVDNCLFYHVDIPSALGAEKLVNIPIKQFIKLTDCKLSDEMNVEISESKSAFLQMSVSEEEINHPSRFLNELNKIVKN